MTKLTKNNSINLVDLDQQGLLNSFKAYMRTQDEFKDYDFNGSSLSVLMELMAMNSFKNAFYLNMSFSERWLDSAQLRSSLFSTAKELNYLPRSSRSAVARVRIDFTATGESQPYVLQKGVPFSTLFKSKSYTFTLPETVSLASADTNFSLTADIYEGVFLQDSYVFQDSDFTQRFKLTNKNIDTRSLTVTVFEDGSQIGTPYKLSRTLLGLDQNSKVFFLQTSETDNYEIYFGDSVIGRKPKNNSIIVLEYRVSSGSAANGAKTFSVDFDPTNANELTGTPTLEVIEAAHNGEEAENNESIRYYAPRHFQVQERAVIGTDYEILLKEEFPEINSIAVFGGEELDPPQFGKVFISIDINNVDGLPDSKKTEYANFLSTRSMFSIIPRFIEPEILNLAVKTVVRYNINVTTNTDNRIIALVQAAIDSYNIDNLNDFNVTLRNSTLIDAINHADDSIISNITTVTAYKKAHPKLGIPQAIIINYGVTIENDLPQQSDFYADSDRKAVWSSEFMYKQDVVNIEDDGNGILRIVKSEGTNKRKILNIGTVNYDKGIINIPDITVDGFLGDAIRFYISPVDPDIFCKNNNIMTILPEDITVIPQNLRE